MKKKSEALFVYEHMFDYTCQVVPPGPPSIGGAPRPLLESAKKLAHLPTQPSLRLEYD